MPAEPFGWWRAGCLSVTGWEIAIEAARGIYSGAIVIFGVGICAVAWRVRKLVRRVDPYIEPGVELLRNASEAARLGLAWLRAQAAQVEDVRATRAAVERTERKVDELLARRLP